MLAFCCGKYLGCRLPFNNTHMANVIKLYRNGTTAGKPGMNKNPPKRGKTTGWSSSTSRRMTKWLYSVNIDKLTGFGYSFTLTIRDCPPTPKDWQMLREAFIVRLKRRGLIRLHWLTEWQSRGVPHLHGCAYFDNEITSGQIILQWLSVADEKYGANLRAQDSKPIDDAIGWYKYLSKHAVRGVQHYQRNSDNMPNHWSNSGRMWGKWGAWDEVVNSPITLTCDDITYYRFRRLVRGWRKAKARSEFSELPSLIFLALHKPKKVADYMVKKRNIVRARTLLKSNNQTLSQIRGVNEFIPQDLAIDFITIAKSHSNGIVEDKDDN